MGESTTKHTLDGMSPTFEKRDNSYNGGRSSSSSQNQEEAKNMNISVARMSRNALGSELETIIESHHSHSSTISRAIECDNEFDHNELGMAAEGSGLQISAGSSYKHEIHSLPADLEIAHERSQATEIKENATRVETPGVTTAFGRTPITIEESSSHCSTPKQSEGLVDKQYEKELESLEKDHELRQTQRQALKSRSSMKGRQS